MSRRNPNQVNAIRDFFAGLLLMSGLHITFGVIWGIVFYLIARIIPDLNSLNGLMIFIIPLLWIGFIQVFYLLPVCSFFAQKQRQEVCKGILTTALLIFSVSLSCAIEDWANLSLMSLLAILIAISTLIGLGLKSLIDRQF
jgi:hypothetical protein